MDDKLFDELLASVHEAGTILRRHVGVGGIIALGYWLAGLVVLALLLIVGGLV